MNEIPEGMKALRDEMAACIRKAGSSTTNRNRASALLAPNGPLWPALRALGEIAMDGNNWTPPYENAKAWLQSADITGPLAAACLAAAEVEP